MIKKGDFLNTFFKSDDAETWKEYTMGRNLVKFLKY